MNVFLTIQPRVKIWSLQVERSLVLLKPDAVQRGLLGKIISRLEQKGLKIIGMKMMGLNDQILAEHYAHLASRPFYPELAEFMQSTPIVALCAEGVDCVATLRRICGITMAREAAAGTIRGDLAMSVQGNLVHASDSTENAEVEIRRFFVKEELFDYHLLLENYIYSSHEGE
jgi:nucleoside-diphosphate kinase